MRPSPAPAAAALSSSQRSTGSVQSSNSPDPRSAMERGAAVIGPGSCWAGQPAGGLSGRKDLPQGGREERTDQLEGEQTAPLLELAQRAPADSVGPSQRLRQGSKGPPRDPSQHGTPWDVGGWVFDQFGHPQGLRRNPEGPARYHLVDVRPELRDARRDQRAGKPQQLYPRHLLAMESLPPSVVESAHRQPLEQQLGIDQARVHPQQEGGVLCIVGKASDLVDPVNIIVNAVDALDRPLRLLTGA